MFRTGVHAVAWLAWALGAAATIEIAPNPLYVALVIGVAALVVQAHASDSPLARAFPIIIGLGIGFAVVRLVLTAATTHGTGDVLFGTPSFTLPRLLGGFSVGGPVVLPVVLQAAADGFVVVGVMSVFGAFNAVVSHYQLVRSAPRAFYEPGLIVTVALAFVPSTVAAIGGVREADRARTGGRVVRRGRLVRLTVPILESGMERAVLLAESMDSRGFARLPASRSDHVAGWCALGALLALGGSFVALVGRADALAAVLAAAGGVTLAVAVAFASRSGRARHRPVAMTRSDWMVVAAAVATPVLVGIAALLGDATLTWSATPLRLPAFDPVVAIAIVGLAAPVLVGHGEREPRPMQLPVPTQP